MKKGILFLLILTLSLSACSLPGGLSPSSGSVQAWLDQPVSGSILPLGSFPLKAHARHIDGSGITRLEFLVNGLSVGTVDTDPSAAIVYGEAAWNASNPGEYQISVRAYAGNQASESLVALVCVSANVTAPVLSAAGGCDAPQQPDSQQMPAAGQVTAAPPTVTATATASASPTAFIPPTPVPPTLAPPTLAPPTVAPPTAIPPTSVPVDNTPPSVDITSVSPEILYYGNGCSADVGTLTVEAYVSDGQSAVTQVYLVYGVIGAGTEGIFVEMSPIGSGYYRGVVDIGSQAYNFLQGANGEVGIAVIGNDAAGNSAQDTAPNLPLWFCPG